jgi:hypothetical protein
VKHLRRLHRRTPDERAAIAGAESLLLGTFVLLSGSLLMIHAWAVLDTHMALDAAAREYLRAYTQESTPTDALQEARRALDDVLADRERLRSTMSVTDADPDLFGPCSPALVELSATVPAMRMPFLGELASQTVIVRHVELVDAHREFSETGDRYDLADTACGG